MNGSGPASYPPPRNCPVCGDELHVTRLGCPSCGSELAGRFAPCPYCALGEQDRQILRTFLVSRGNMRELARDLKVSYPTARQRFGEMLGRLGLEVSAGHDGHAHAGAASREDVLRRLAAGDLDLDEASVLLNAAGRGPSEQAAMLADDIDDEGDTE
ncbi:MAG: DUF2089 domain-containing protein [Jiangellaceae bacterium]